MNRVIFPTIFNGEVKAFFTTKSLGADIKKISNFLSIKKEYIYLPQQRHTDKVLVVKSDLEPEIADAVVTRRKGILIGVQVADCVPILLFVRTRSIVGAVHAGWRSTAAEIIKKTITVMITQFSSSPKEILIALGPSIRGKCYEVGYEVYSAIHKATGEGEYYTQSDGKYSIDLSHANRHQALSMGVPEENIWLSHECTFCNPEEYYSYRYNKSLIGSQGGFIGVF